MHLYNDFSKKVFAKGAKSAQHYIIWTSALLGSIRWGKENLHSKPYILFATVHLSYSPAEPEVYESIRRRDASGLLRRKDIS